MRSIHVVVVLSVLGLSAAAMAQKDPPANHGQKPAAAAPASPAPAAVQEVRVVVERGYHPNRVEVTEGTPIRLTFLRKEHAGCTKEVVFPTLGITKALPLNEEVVIDIPAQPAGELAFHCGMKMVHGKVVVKPKG